jgi:protein-S-isoprenylcysteine O-methyltransferase Ste14
VNVESWKQIRAILVLPGMVTIVIPATILYFNGINGFPAQWNVVLPIIGCVFVILGLALMVWTNRLFITVGKGTLAPWNPPQKFVVHGIYQHVRNPMLLGVFSILLGEAFFFGSLWLLGWFSFFCLLNMIYIQFVEEPGLVKRFGDDYLLYKKHVPRWIPRVKPWER